MCFWHFLSNILQEHTQPLLTGLATSFHDPTAHSVQTHKRVFELGNVDQGSFYKFTRQAYAFTGTTDEGIHDVSNTGHS